MENFFIDENFYPDTESLLADIEINEKEDAEALPDDYKLRIEESSLEKVFVATEDWIVDTIIEATDQYDDRFPEEADHVFEEIKKAIRASIDVEKLNSLLPSLFYPNGKMSVLTKQDLLDAC